VEQTELLAFAVETLERLAIPYAIVGSIASGAWGESRFTQDIDVLVDLATENVAALCSAFPESDFYVSQDAARDAVARRGQFNVIHPASGNKIDFMIAGDTPWAASQLKRIKRLPLFPSQDGAFHDAAFAAPEDVILSKLNYFREGGSDKHLRDIAGVLKISGDFVDRAYITRFAAEFGVTDIWQAVLDRVDGGRAKS
jgi:hypothetical protein